MFYFNKKYFNLSILLILLILFLGTFKTNINAESTIKGKTKNKLNNYSKGIVIDSSGNIYIGNQILGEVDSYSKDGKYMYKLSCNTYGEVRIDIDNNDNIMIGVAREETLLVYDKLGKLISTNNDPDAFERIGEKNDKEFKDKNGNIYRIEHQSLFGRTRITKTANNGVKTTIMSMDKDEYVNKVVKVTFLILIFTTILIIIIYNVKRKLR